MSAEPPIQRTIAVLVLLVLAPATLVFTLVEPIPQPPEYFDFADQRKILGVSNFWNVITNIVFVAAGITGLASLKRNTLVIDRELRIAACILFAGVLLTAFGSAWFHLAPSNDSLVWDRLPMTVGFMSLFAIVIGEQLSMSLARAVLWPLLVLGFASVSYWDVTEARGAGDLRLYGLVQFLPLAVIPVLLFAWPSPYNSIRFFWFALGLYALAKVFEALDEQIFGIGGIQSGHALKHVAAGAAMYVLVLGMQKRKRLGGEGLGR